MALKDKGLTEEVVADFEEYAAQSPEGKRRGYTYLALVALAEGSHKSDIGVLHRMVRNKLGRP